MKWQLNQFKNSARATTKFLSQSSLKREDVQEVLKLLTPYGTMHPLVRIGGPGDGGYLLPDDLEGLAGSFSPGVSDMMNFDLEMMARGIPTFFADASIDGLPENHPLATFEKLFLGAKSAGNTVSLDDWVSRHAPDTGDLILQMDIEGAEYETLLPASDATLGRFRIIIVEFHSFERIAEPDIFPRYAEVFEKINRQFRVVHLHPNNCLPPVNIAGLKVPRILEATFLREDRCRDVSEREDFPHQLDSTNVAANRDFPMPKFWKARARRQGHSSEQAG